MGSVHKFRRPPKNKGQFRGWRPPEPPRGPKRKKPRRSWGMLHSLLVLIGFALLIALGMETINSEQGETFTCRGPQITDGDTFRCGARRVRLAGIDAPEMPGHCQPGRDCVPGDPNASKANLARLAGYGPLECRQVDMDRYGRTVARCSKDGADLSCAQLEAGQAIRRYGQITC